MARLLFTSLLRRHALPITAQTNTATSNIFPPTAINGPLLLFHYHLNSPPQSTIISTTNRNLCSNKHDLS
jgi:hypothetical protein